jgi:hypothetical protein
MILSAYWTAAETIERFVLPVCRKELIAFESLILLEGKSLEPTTEREHMPQA